MNRKNRRGLAALAIGAIALGATFALSARPASADGFGKIIAAVNQLFGGNVDGAGATTGQTLLKQADGSWKPGSISSSQTLAQTLANGNGSGANDIAMASAQQVTWNGDSGIKRAGAAGLAITDGTTGFRNLFATSYRATSSGFQWSSSSSDPTTNPTWAVLGATSSGVLSLGATAADATGTLQLGLATIVNSGAGAGAGLSVTAASITQGLSGSAAKFVGAANQVVSVGMGVTGSGGIIGFGRSSDGAIAGAFGQAANLGGGQSDTVVAGSGIRICSDGNASGSGEIGFYIAPSLAVEFGNTRATTTKKWTIQDVAGYPLVGQAGMVLGWAPSTDAGAAADIGFSRIGVASSAVGNGTAGDFTGTLKLTTLTLAGNGSLAGSSDGVWIVKDNAGTSFGRLQFGGTTTSFPALRRTSAGLDCVLGDASAFTTFNASTFILANGTKISNPSATDGIMMLSNNAASGFTRLQIGGTSASFPAIRRNSTGLDFVTADDLSFSPLNALSYQLSSGAKWSGATDGIALFTNAAGTDFTRIQLGGTTSSFPAFRHSGSTLELVSADNSTFVPFSCANLVLATSSSVIAQYKGVATTAFGVPAIYASGRFTGQTGAKASVATYTPTADGSFDVVMNVLVTTATTHTFTCQCTYTDEGNTARTITIPFRLVGDTTALTSSIANGNGAVPYNGVPVRIRAKASTAITLLTQAAGTYTTVTYNVEGEIRQSS